MSLPDWVEATIAPLASLTVWLTPTDWSAGLVTCVSTWTVA